MAINVIEYAEVWTTTLDKQVQQVATTAWMENNSEQIEYRGGKKVRVPEMYTTGLGDYSRGTGTNNPGKYAKGKVEIKFRDYEMEMDRSTSFLWDRNDYDETAFILSAPNVMGVFQTDHYIPEIDSFRYSRIASLVMAKGTEAYRTQTITAENALSEFLSSIRAMQNVTGINTADLVATMPWPIYSLIEQAALAKGIINSALFMQGGLQFEVRSINSIPLIPVVEDRMKTAYIFHSGDEQTGENLGFEPAPGAKTINWIIQPRSLPVAISKTDSLKIWTPETNILGDDWLIQFRKYHDLWILHNQLNQVVLSVQP